MFQATENFIFPPAILFQFSVGQGSQEMTQNFTPRASLQNKRELIVKHLFPGRSQEFSPSGQVRRMTVNEHPIHVENDCVNAHIFCGQPTPLSTKGLPVNPATFSAPFRSSREYQCRGRNQKSERRAFGR